MMQAEGGNPPPCPILSELYKSERPAVELLPGIPLAPVVIACWPHQTVQALLSESWLPKGPEEGKPKPPTFDPSASDYVDLPLRVGRSQSMSQWNNLKIKVKEVELDLTKCTDEESKAAKSSELEEAQRALVEAEAQLSNLKASFEPDALALVPWMQTLFALADAGLTTFEVSGAFFPHCKLNELFGSAGSASLFDGVEKLLGTFKRRYEQERGAGKVSVLTKIAPNIFTGDYSPAAVEAAVDRSRRNILGADSTTALDLVQLFWYDFQQLDPTPTLRELRRLCEDVTEVNEATGTRTVVTPRKLAGIGLVDFPISAIRAALQAGVQVTCVQLTYCVTDTSAYEVLQYCRQQGIKVLAKGGLMGGLISEKYLGTDCPDPLLSPDTDLDSVADARDAVVAYGNWDTTQRLLRTLKAIADKHSVKMQTVSLRWQMDQGVFPITSMHWPPNPWKMFGHSYPQSKAPGVDAALFQKASFLDADDNARLNALLK